MKKLLLSFCAISLFTACENHPKSPSSEVERSVQPLEVMLAGQKYHRIVESDGSTGAPVGTFAHIIEFAPGSKLVDNAPQFYGNTPAILSFTQTGALSIVVEVSEDSKMTYEFSSDLSTMKSNHGAIFEKLVTGPTVPSTENLESDEATVAASVAARLGLSPKIVNDCAETSFDVIYRVSGSSKSWTAKVDLYESSLQFFEGDVFDVLFARVKVAAKAEGASDIVKKATLKSTACNAIDGIWTISFEKAK